MQAGLGAAVAAARERWQPPFVTSQGPYLHVTSACASCKRECYVADYTVALISQMNQKKKRRSKRQVVMNKSMNRHIHSFTYTHKYTVYLHIHVYFRARFILTDVRR